MPLRPSQATRSPGPTPDSASPVVARSAAWSSSRYVQWRPPMTPASWSGCVFASPRTLSSTRRTDPGSLEATTRGLLAGRTALAARPPYLRINSVSLLPGRAQMTRGAGDVAAPQAVASAAGPLPGRRARAADDIPDIIGRDVGLT